jgi:addiction module HigA family antidote
MRIPTHRPPTHPGEMLLEEFLVPMGITQQALATSINLPLAKVEAMISGNQDMTPGVALRLAKFFGMSADFWMTLQLRWDLYHAQQEEADALEKIHPYTAAS